MKFPLKWLVVGWLVVLLGLALLDWYGGPEPAQQPPPMWEF